MSSPQDNLSRLLRNCSDVDTLYELLVWVHSAKGIVEDLEVDDLLGSLYGKTSDGSKHRSEHEKRLTSPRSRPLRVSVEENKSAPPA